MGGWGGLPFVDGGVENRGSLISVPLALRVRVSLKIVTHSVRLVADFGPIVAITILAIIYENIILKTSRTVAASQKI